MNDPDSVNLRSDGRPIPLRSTAPLDPVDRRERLVRAAAVVVVLVIVVGFWWLVAVLFEKATGHELEGPAGAVAPLELVVDDGQAVELELPDEGLIPPAYAELPDEGVPAGDVDSDADVDPAGVPPTLPAASDELELEAPAAADVLAGDGDDPAPGEQWSCQVWADGVTPGQGTAPAWWAGTLPAEVAAANPAVVAACEAVVLTIPSQ